MAANPNPSRITNELWYFWEEFKKFEPKVLLGGIYADKPGYHNTRAANMLKYPGNYSYADYALDRQGPSDKAAAIDLTFPDAQAGNYSTIAKYSNRLLLSGKDPNDNRLNVLREFYGNTDSDTEVEGWDYQAVRAATSDKTHLWHIHISVMRAYVTSKIAMDSILNVLKGISGEEPLDAEDIKKIVAEIWKWPIETSTADVVLGRAMAGAEKAAADSIDIDLLAEAVRRKLNP